MGGSRWWKFTESYIYDLCTFLYMCYTSINTLRKVLIRKAPRGNGTPSAPPPFLAAPGLCSLHSYDTLLITGHWFTLVGCSSFEDFCPTAFSAPRYPHSSLPHLIQVSAWTSSYQRTLPDDPLGNGIFHCSCPLALLYLVQIHITVSSIMCLFVRWLIVCLSY